jgi:hypothetical protein
MKDCPNRAENLKSCGCTYSSCSRRGMCCECIRHHKAKGELPGCLFPREAEKTYDRSVKRFLESVEIK